MNNGSVSSELLLERLKWRYAVKRFDPAKKIDEPDWQALEFSMMLSPSSYGLQPWKFYVVTDDEIKKRLRPQSYDQPQIEE